MASHSDVTFGKPNKFAVAHSKIAKTLPSLQERFEKEIQLINSVATRNPEEILKAWKDLVKTHSQLTWKECVLYVLHMKYKVALFNNEEDLNSRSQSYFLRSVAHAINVKKQQHTEVEDFAPFKNRRAMRCKALREEASVHREAAIKIRERLDEMFIRATLKRAATPLEITIYEMVATIQCKNVIEAHLAQLIVLLNSVVKYIG